MYVRLGSEGIPENVLVFRNSVGKSAFLGVSLLSLSCILCSLEQHGNCMSRAQTRLPIAVPHSQCNQRTLIMVSIVNFRWKSIDWALHVCGSLLLVTLLVILALLAK